MDNATLIRSPYALGTTLITLLIDAYGMEVVDYEAETVAEALGELASGPVPLGNVDKANALCLVLVSDSFYIDPNAFTFVANALGDTDPVDFKVWDPPLPEEVAWAVAEVALHTPPSREDPLAQRFSREVAQLAGAVFGAAGMTAAPAPVQFFKVPGAGRIVEDLQTDPVFYQAYWQRQLQAQQAVTQFVDGRTGLLVRQLREIKLAHGSTDKLLERFQQNLRKGPELGSLER